MPTVPPKTEGLPPSFDAVQLVAPVVDHVRFVDWPKIMLVGEAEIETVGTGYGVVNVMGMETFDGLMVPA